MLIKLTNSNPILQGMPIYLMPEHILSVYETPTDSGSLVTCIYGIRGDIWQVEEGLYDTIKIINGVKQ